MVEVKKVLCLYLSVSFCVFPPKLEGAAEVGKGARQSAMACGGVAEADEIKEEVGLPNARKVAHLNARIAEFEKAEADFGAWFDHFKRELAEMERDDQFHVEYYWCVGV